ncbi:MAG TPA: hypothetical protein VHW66_20360 [Stellaceae bacterium]|jgi:hypothetical protein|nr:hypothetical protein [Stellaceae bacterium]
MANSVNHKTAPTHPGQPNVVAVVADHVASAVDSGQTALKGVQFFSGSEAFRRYNWLRQIPTYNVAGDLRGVVINANARVIYNFSTNALNKLDKFGGALLLASVAIDLAKQTGEIKAIAASNAPWEVKASKFSLIGSMTILRALTGIVPAGAHLIALSLEGYAGLADQATGHSRTTQNALSGLRATDAKVTSFYNRVLNADNAYDFIQTKLVF